ncbi:MAG: protease modulator HflC [Deltaproteobacteria bacterium]|jgi:membrane protease subunit HflC|nr:protease modulator HflC [Deltaproteobacteria bacterium]
MSKRLFTFLSIGFLLVLVFVQSVFTVHQTQKALILQLGMPMGETLLPGLHFKLPFFQNVLYFDARIINYDATSVEALTKDKKVIILDNYAKWRIVDPLAFYQNLRTVPSAQASLKQIIQSEQLAVVGTYDLTEVVSTKRQAIMERVRDQANDKIKKLGVEVVDVRIKRTDLPPENQRAIFNRMTAERERQAMEYRSEGEKDATIIKSTTDRDRAILLAEAQKQSEIIRGEGDAEATRIFAEAISGSLEFYDFSRSLEAYKKSLSGKTRLVLDPDGEFLRFLRGKAN